MKIEDIVAEKTKFETPALAEIEVGNLKVGDTFQFERRGFYYYDGKTNDTMNLHYIPEGKSKMVSKIQMNVYIIIMTLGRPKFYHERRRKKGR